jgi:uncharacterized protein
MQENAVPAPEPTRFLPLITDFSRPFWDATKRHELMVQQCQNCGNTFYPPSVACGRCFTTDVKWVKSSGKAKLTTYSVVHQPAGPGFPVPLILAIVQMDEGYRMMTNIVGCDPKELKIGMPLEVTFEEQTPTVTLPFFQPTKQG